jgi:uncharacterized membrane protein YjgN (DUF898 family)
MNDVAQIRALVRQSQSIAFTGERRDFFRLVRRGALLELITAGFYRFWLATDIRRSLWSGTLVDGHAPEYTGTAKELLIGFLFALQSWCRSISCIFSLASRPSAPRPLPAFR